MQCFLDRCPPLSNFFDDPLENIHESFRLAIRFWIERGNLTTQVPDAIGSAIIGQFGVSAVMRMVAVQLRANNPRRAFLLWIGPVEFRLGPAILNVAVDLVEQWICTGALRDDSDIDISGSGSR